MEMSRHNFRPIAWPKWGASLCALIAVVATALWTSCDSGDDSEAGLDKYFLRDVAAMQAAGLPVYWLGTGFTVDGQVFRGPYVAEFGAQVEGGGIDMTYQALLPDGGAVPLELVVYSRAAWELVKDRTVNPGLAGVTRRAVSVGGREGELLFLPLGTRPLNVLRLVLDLDDVVVVGEARSVIGATPSAGTDLNPIINNPDLLIQVMDNLRSYPQ